MNKLLTCLILLLSHLSFSQIDIDTISKARYGISSVVMGDTIIIAGGDNYDYADFYHLDNGIVDVQAYTPNDGFETAEVLSDGNIAFFYDLSNVNLSIRDFYKYDKAQNLWSDGKYGVPFDEDVLFLDGELIYSYLRSYPDSVSVFNIRTNERYKIESNIPVREFGISQNEDFVYCVGGITEDGSLSDDLNIYNKSTKEWSKYSLQRARREPNTIIHQNKLIINGGFNDFSSEVEIFDLTTFTSETLELPQSNRDGLLLASGETLVVAGGSRNYAVDINLTTLAVGEKYILEEAAINTGLDFLQGETLGDQIIFGGDRYPRYYIYNTTDKSWSIVPMDFARRRASMFKHDNRVYFIGGRDGDIKSNAITVFDILNSISEEELISFNVFPNPTSSSLTIDYRENDIYDILVYNQGGELVLSTVKSDKIDLSNLSSGAYFVKLNIENKKSIIRKLIIN